MAQKRKSNGHGKMIGLIFVVLAYLGVLSAVLMQGNNIALFNPKGMVAQEELNLMLLTVGIMLIIAIPAIFLFYFTAWKYRESNHKAKRDPHAGHGKLLNASMWGIPFIFMLVLAGIMWPATQRLEPKKQIANGVEPMTIQVIAMRWKWVFIYPEQQIATVNHVQVPVGTPVNFLLTADEAPMSAFWIPNLGGMLYAMNGHVNSLNLVADKAGEYPGSTAEINGAGFAGMKFVASAMPKSAFDLWAEEIKLSANPLSTAEYEQLLKPSENNPAAYYSLPDTDLYAKVVMKYMGSHDHQPAAHEGAHH
jgi:cytochrome o ubiquinol oxidase subunit II